MISNYVLHDLNYAHKLNFIKEITITLKDGDKITLNNELYILKCNDQYVIFQANPSINYSVEHLADIRRTIDSLGASISFTHNTEYVNIDEFYSDNIKFDFADGIKLGVEYYFIAAIFIPIPYTCFDLRNYVGNLYKMYSGDGINISTTTYYVKDTIIPRYVRGSIASDIEKVIFNDPATIVVWSDGTKTVVKTQNNEKYDKEKGLALAISKKVLGNTSKYYDTFKKWIK